MQWDASPNAGFSPVQPWLPLHPDYPRRNLARQKQDPSSIFNFYRRLIELRRQLPALRQGMFMPLTYDPWYILGYLRQIGDQMVLVGLNFSRFSSRLVLGGWLAHARWQLLLSNKKQKLEPIRSGLLPLEGEEACLLLLES